MPSHSHVRAMPNRSSNDKLQNLERSTTGIHSGDLESLIVQRGTTSQRAASRLAASRKPGQVEREAVNTTRYLLA